MQNKYQQPQETIIKIITLGLIGAGKTSLLLRLTQDSFSENQLVTIGVDQFIKNMFINNQDVKLQIWDTAGQEKYKAAISSSYYKGVHGIFFTFDISNEQSFLEVHTIFDQTINEIKNMDQNISCVLVGCKNDLETKREISYDVAMAFAEKLGMLYIETSAKLNKNCLQAADCLAKLCLEQIKNNKSENTLEFALPLQIDQQDKSLCF